MKKAAADKQETHGRLDHLSRLLLQKFLMTFQRKAHCESNTFEPTDNFTQTARFRADGLVVKHSITKLK